MRLDKYLADSGVGTRRDVKKMILQKRVSINGEMTVDPGAALSPEKDEVLVDDTKVCYERFVYLMMNKPAGVITATEDSREQTVLDLLKPPIPKDLAPVGRLDKDTVGLLLLTNDGALAHRLLSPKYHVAKTYYAKVTGEGRWVDETDVAAFEEGIKLTDHLCMPAGLLIIKNEKDPATGQCISETRVIIHEGKFHQVKRMFAARGFKVFYLKREAMGSLKLDPGLKEGEYRRLTGDELGGIR